MKPRTCLVLLPALFGAALISSCATAPSVDPSAQITLRQTTEKLRNARTIQVSGSRLADTSLLPAGSTREFVRFDLAVQRPGSLAVKSSDGGDIRHLIAGDGGITMYDEKANVYTTSDTEADTIDGLVEAIENTFDTKMALSEMLGEDPMAMLMDEVTSVKSAGEETVEGTRCSRLDFTQNGLNWQLWIAKSDSLPRKIALTYLDKPGHPRRIVTIKRWTLNGKIPASLFSFTPKNDAEEVEVIH